MAENSGGDEQPPSSPYVFGIEDSTRADEAAASSDTEADAPAAGAPDEIPGPTVNDFALAGEFAAPATATPLAASAGPSSLEWGVRAALVAAVVLAVILPLVGSSPASDQAAGGANHHHAVQAATSSTTTTAPRTTTTTKAPVTTTTTTAPPATTTTTSPPPATTIPPAPTTTTTRPPAPTTTTTASGGPTPLKTVTVSDVVGYTSSAADGILANEGLEPSGLCEVSPTGRGAVVSQSPPSGSVVNKGSVVTFTVTQPSC